MGNRACVFVDGENFRHTICDLFDHFSPAEYLPRRANWAGLFDWFVQQASPEAERVRTYWYVIQWMDFYPFALHRLRRNADKLKQVLCEHPPYADELGELRGSGAIQRMQKMVQRLDETRRQMQDRFSEWTSIQNGIAHRHRAVEFRRAGAIKCRLFDCALGPEKAVDVKLATDLIVLKGIYDVAVIVSGDQDYVPAVQVIKDDGKTAVNVAFKTRGGRLLPGGARRLNQATDQGLEIAYSDLAGHLGL